MREGGAERRERVEGGIILTCSFVALGHLEWGLLEYI